MSKFEQVSPGNEEPEEIILSDEKIAPIAQDTEKEKPFEGFTLEQNAEIHRRQRILSSLGRFIGKDFEMPVELNERGAGWHWDHKENVIRVDPQDLLERSMDYLRFVISHEGGHRRITRTEHIDEDLWKLPGFHFMLNVVEDGRDNNFVAESYPRFREQMRIAYEEDFAKSEERAKSNAEDSLGYKPRFMQAGFEYLRQWFRESQGREFAITEDLAPEIREVLDKTLGAAQESWWRYPSRQEADRSEDLIKAYSKLSYEINRDHIWPEFKKLVDMDIEDQKKQEILNEMQDSSVPEELKNLLTPEELKELEEALQKATGQAQPGQGGEGKSGNKEQGGQGQTGGAGTGEENPQESGDGSQGGPGGSVVEKPGKGQGGTEGGEVEKKRSAVKLDELSKELKGKLDKLIDSLPEDVKKDLAEAAMKSLKEFSDQLDQELQGKMVEEVEKGDEPTERADIASGNPSFSGELSDYYTEYTGDKLYQQRTEREFNEGEAIYEKYRIEVMPMIDKLEQELRQIFVDREITAWKTGFRTGKRIDISRRIQEKAKKIPAVRSQAWQKREQPDQADYDISILVDLSGSMRQDGKIEETFKGVVTLVEVLNRLGINTELIGFNDELTEYQNFGQPLSKAIRSHMGGMFKEVDDSCCRSCGQEHNETDLGWATKTAAERLAKQKSKNKFLITLSDGQLEESPRHPASEYELAKTIQDIDKETEVHVIGLGIGEEAGAMTEGYYPHVHQASQITEMPKELAKLIKDAIANYDKF